MNDLSSEKHCFLDFLSPSSLSWPRSLEGLFERTQYPLLSSSIASLPTGKQAHSQLWCSRKAWVCQNTVQNNCCKQRWWNFTAYEKDHFLTIILDVKSQQKGVELVTRPDTSSANVAKPSKSRERSSWAWIKLTSSTFKKHALPIRMSLLTCLTSAQNASKGWGLKEHWTFTLDKSTLKNATSAVSVTWSIQTRCSTNATSSNAMAQSKKSSKRKKEELNQFARSVRKSSQAN